MNEQTDNPFIVRSQLLHSKNYTVRFGKSSCTCCLKSSHKHLRTHKSVARYGQLKPRVSNSTFFWGSKGVETMFSHITQLLTKAQFRQNTHSGKRGQENGSKCVYGSCVKVGGCSTAKSQSKF